MSIQIPKPTKDQMLAGGIGFVLGGVSGLAAASGQINPAAVFMALSKVDFSNPVTASAQIVKLSMDWAETQGFGTQIEFLDALVGQATEERKKTVEKQKTAERVRAQKFRYGGYW
jgi:hypothetical protein